MKYLEDLGFTPEDTNVIKNSNQEEVIDRINHKEELITSNISFLKNLGVENYKDLFIKYAEFFLQDRDVFEGIFSKYDRDDLVVKLKKNPAIIVRL